MVTSFYALPAILHSTTMKLLHIRISTLIHTPVLQSTSICNHIRQERYFKLISQSSQRTFQRQFTHYYSLTEIYFVLVPSMYGQICLCFFYWILHSRTTLKYIFSLVYSLQNISNPIAYSLLDSNLYSISLHGKSSHYSLFFVKRFCDEIYLLLLDSISCYIWY